jgi:hypothetical protein
VNIVIEYDSSAASAPAGFKAAVEAAVQFYDYLIADPISVSIVFSYGELDGSNIASNAIAESSTNGNIETFTSVVNLLTAAATSAADHTSLTALATSDPTNGGRFWVSDAQAKLFGLGAEPGYTDPEDGFVGVSASVPLTWDQNNRAVAGEYDAVGAIEHEIAEVLGRFSYLGGSGSFNGFKLYSPLDLFRYSAPGVHTVAFGPGSFSVDGQTLLLPFNNPKNGGDGGDWAPSVAGDSYGSGSAGSPGLVSQTDLLVMDVLGYQIAPLGNPVAGAAPTFTATNGGTISISNASITGLISNDYLGALSITSAFAASPSAGVLTIDQADGALLFTPAAGFAGATTGSVTVYDGNGGSVVQTININVVVQASAPVVTLPNTVTTAVSGNVTTITTRSPTGVLISTETITVNGAQTISQFFNAAGAQTAATIQQIQGGGFTQVQNFDGAWNQLNASITQDNGGGNTVVQYFDGAWVQTSGVITTVSGATTEVQNFDPHWNQTSATLTQVIGNMTETQHFNASWVQTSANLSFDLGGGTIESQNFDANWVQTSASITTHPSANQTTVQNFSASWVQTSASTTTIAGGQTTIQSFDATWNQLSATIDTPNAFGSGSDRFQTFDAHWNLASEIDTATNTGQSYFTFGVAGSVQSYTAPSGHSTTFVFTPGSIAGDSITGLHSLNLGGAIHDVIDFQGYGAGAHLVQVDSTHWQVVSTNHATESFQILGGSSLGDGDYAFVSSSPTSSQAGGIEAVSSSASITLATGGGGTVGGISVTPTPAATPTSGQSPGAGTAILIASDANQTLTSIGGGQTLYGSSAGYDTFEGAAADLSGDTLVNFGRAGDQLHVTDAGPTWAGPGFVEDASNTFGTLSINTGSAVTKVVLFGQFMASGFQSVSDGGAGQVITYAPAITTPAIAPPT